MVRSPIRLVCGACGLDLSSAVNSLIRQQYATQPPAAAAAEGSPSVSPSAASPVIAAPQSSAEPSRVAAPKPIPVALPPRATPGLRVSAAAGQAAATAPAPEALQPCLKHPGQWTGAHHCRVCQKPMCPKCMEISGYVCSPFCRARAEAEGIEVPTFAGQRDVAQSRQWRKTALIATVVVSVIGAILGTWFWYAWIATVPKVALSIPLPERSASGRLILCPNQQLVLLHAGTLARHDAKANQAVWSIPIIDRARVREKSAALLKDIQDNWRRQLESGDYVGRALPTLDEIIAQVMENENSALSLHVQDENIWVASPEKLSRYDWQTGKLTHDVARPNSWSQIIPTRDELIVLPGSDPAAQAILHVNLATGEPREESFGRSQELAATPKAVKPPATARRSQPGAVRDPTQDPKPLDPVAIAARAQNMSTAERLALPATIAIQANQQRLLQELRGTSTPGGAANRVAPTVEPESERLFPTPNGMLVLGSKLLKVELTERKAMKDAPRKSALDGPVNAAATKAIANELLNEIQRERGADVVVENHSRYQVTLRQPGAAKGTGWLGESEGEPDLFPARTVNVIAAGKTAVVLDQNQKKLWSLQLNYNLARPDDHRLGFPGHPQPYGEGPVVEHGDTLFIFDQGTLTACELSSGNVRWRLPSVGTLGLYFDEDGQLYVNSTTASPEGIKLSNQIDIDNRVFPRVLKLDPRTGRTLWKAEREGYICNISGKFIYTVEAHVGEEPLGGDRMDVRTGLEIPPHIRIKRLHASHGRVVWEHYEKQAPIDVRFEKTSFYVLFKKEAQMLRFFSL